MEPNDLLYEFPDLKGKIDTLEKSDAYFKKIMDEYSEIHLSIKNIERGATVATEELLNELRIKLIILKNKLAEYSTLE